MEGVAEGLILTILSSMDDYVSEMTNVPRWVNVISGDKFRSRCTRSRGVARTSAGPMRPTEASWYFFTEEAV